MELVELVLIRASSGQRTCHPPSLSLPVFLQMVLIVVVSGGDAEDDDDGEEQDGGKDGGLECNHGG